MNVTIEIDEHVVRQVIDYADDEILTFQEAVSALLSEAIQGKKLTELDDEELDQMVQDMISHAIGNEEREKIFKTNELYMASTGEKWAKLSPSTRKSLGRRFRAAIEEHAEWAEAGDPIIKFIDRNINNAAVYHVVEK